MACGRPPVVSRGGCHRRRTYRAAERTKPPASQSFRDADRRSHFRHKILQERKAADGNDGDAGSPFFVEFLCREIAAHDTRHGYDVGPRADYQASRLL